MFQQPRYLLEWEVSWKRLAGGVRAAFPGNLISSEVKIATRERPLLENPASTHERSVFDAPSPEIFGPEVMKDEAPSVCLELCLDWLRKGGVSI